MAWWRIRPRPGLRLRLVAVALMLAGQALAQDVPAPLLTLDQDRFFLQSDFGKAAIERERTATAALEQENKRIEADLIAEEQALTEERKTLPPKEFAAKAEAFDQKVERIRAEQDAKSRQLTEARRRDRKAFLQAARAGSGRASGAEEGHGDPGQEPGDRVAVSVDVTDEAIAAVNLALAKKPDPAP
jgi:hypothetical protein